MYTIKIATSRRGYCLRKARRWVRCVWDDSQGHRNDDRQKLCFPCLTMYARLHRATALVWELGESVT